MSEKTFCTLVFEYDLTKHNRNAFHEDTPFGKPCGQALGDLMVENREISDRVSALEAYVEYLEKGGGDLDDFKKELGI